MGVPLHILVGMRWLTYLMALNNVAAWLGVLPGAPTISWWWVAASWAVFVSPWGRMAISVVAARLLLRGVRPGSYPRSGKVHLRLWLAEQIADMSAAVSLASAPWVPYYARALGVKMGRNVDLHSVPPVTGLLRLAEGCSDGTGGGSFRLVDRRRLGAHWRNLDWRRCRGGRPQHADAGRPHRRRGAC